MLEFYQGQHTVQNTLAIFLDIYPSDHPNKQLLIALTNKQIERLTFLTRELENPSPFYPPETSMRVWEEYYKSYGDQQRLLLPIVMSNVALHLPSIELPAVPMEEEEVLEQGAAGGPAYSSFENITLGEYGAALSYQLPGSALNNNNADNSVTPSSLRSYSPHSFFPAPEKPSASAGTKNDKYAIYERRLRSLKEKQDPLSPEEKKECRLLSNRLAAHRSRVNKKEYVQELEASLEENRAKKRELEETKFRLTAEQQDLKEQRLILMGIVAKLGVDPASLLNAIALPTDGLEEEQPLQGPARLG